VAGRRCCRQMAEARLHVSKSKILYAFRKIHAILPTLWPPFC